MSITRGTADVMQCTRTVGRISAHLVAAIMFWSCVATALLLSSVATAAADESAATKAPAEAVRQSEAADKVSVFYLTNRQRQERKPVDETYSGDRGAPHFGRCEVEFTPIPSGPARYRIRSTRAEYKHAPMRLVGGEVLRAGAIDLAIKMAKR